MRWQKFLDAHLNVNWLRPESALWDTIASGVVSRYQFLSPSLDLGSGNGIFSFITAGGAFSPDYDWYRNVDPDGFWDNRDIYDVLTEAPKEKWIVARPHYLIDCAVDAKRNLLHQARALGFYQHTLVADANFRLPFEDNSFQTVFSNILYWLSSAESAFGEIRRVLRPQGRSLLCLQNERFKQYCISYQWRELDSEVLRLLNRGRSESSYWTISYSELVALARKSGFKIVWHSYYLSPLTLKVWDIGLRPLSPVLLKMVKQFTEAERLSIKTEWVETVRPFLRELCRLEEKNCEQGGYHCVCLEKVS